MKLLVESMKLVACLGVYSKVVKISSEAQDRSVCAGGGQL